MALVPFLCPVCSAPSASAALDRFNCPRCCASYPPTRIDRLARTLGGLAVEPGETPEALHERLLKRLASVPLPGDPMSPWNEKLATRAARVIGTSGDATGPAIVVAVAAPWTHALTVSLFNDLLKLAKFMEEGRVVSRFQFVAPQPIPEAIQYAFAATNRGRFERIALREIGLYDPEILVPPERVPKLLQIARKLAETCFHLTFDLREVREAKWIEELVLKDLRLPHPPHEPIPPAAYTPHCSLLLMALLLGQILLQQRGGAGWQEERSFPFSLSLVLNPDEKVDPIGQTLNLFRSGAAASIAATAQELTKVRRRP